MCDDVWGAEKIDSWSDLTEWVEEVNTYASSGVSKYLYRGQARPYGSLLPTLTRYLLNTNMSESDRDKLEGEMLKRFVREAHIHMDDLPAKLTVAPIEATFLSWWGVMLQYRAVTRVLDWTGSPYVAVYFAVEKDFDKDGEVFCYNQELLENVHAQWVRDQKLKCWPVQLSREAYNSSYMQVDGKAVIHHFIHEEQTARMAAQQGVFTVCTDILADHAKLLACYLGEGQRGSGYRRAIIPGKLKPKFLKRLREMNITAKAMFPGIAGIGLSLAEHVRVLTRQGEARGPHALGDEGLARPALSGPGACGRPGGGADPQGSADRGQAEWQPEPELPV